MCPRLQEADLAPEEDHLPHAPSGPSETHTSHKAYPPALCACGEWESAVSYQLVSFEVLLKKPLTFSASFFTAPEPQAFVPEIIPLTVQIAAAIASPIFSPRSINRIISQMDEFNPHL